MNPQPTAISAPGGFRVRLLRQSTVEVEAWHSSQLQAIPQSGGFGKLGVPYLGVYLQQGPHYLGFYTRLTFI